MKDEIIENIGPTMKLCQKLFTFLLASLLYWVASSKKILGHEINFPTLLAIWLGPVNSSHLWNVGQVIYTTIILGVLRFCVVSTLSFLICHLDVKNSGTKRFRSYKMEATWVLESPYGGKPPQPQTFTMGYYIRDK